jgi:hypothetical protein
MLHRYFEEMQLLFSKDMQRVAELSGSLSYWRVPAAAGSQVRRSQVVRVFASASAESAAERRDAIGAHTDPPNRTIL